MSARAPPLPTTLAAASSSYSILSRINVGVDVSCIQDTQQGSDRVQRSDWLDCAYVVN